MMTVVNTRECTKNFLVGERIRVTRVIDLSPHAVIDVGEEGTVIRADEEGNTDIRMDVFHPGLSGWGNTIWIIPDEHTEDIENSIERVKEKRPSTTSHCLMRLAALALFCMVLGATVYEALDVPDTITHYLWEE